MTKRKFLAYVTFHTPAGVRNIEAVDGGVCSHDGDAIDLIKNADLSSLNSMHPVGIHVQEVDAESYLELHDIPRDGAHDTAMDCLDDFETQYEAGDEDDGDYDYDEDVVDEDLATMLDDFAGQSGSVVMRVLQMASNWRRYCEKRGTPITFDLTKLAEEDEEEIEETEEDEGDTE